MKNSALKTAFDIAIPNLAGRILAIASVVGTLLGQTTQGADDWTAKAISPVVNPLFFESPLIQSEVRPLFVYHKIDDDFIGGFARVYAVQLRYAVTERLAIIATKDGYIQLRPGVAALRDDGWADIGAGIKYAVIDDRESNFILTPGIKFELPSGNQGVFQGNGSGEFNVFVSSMKGWGDFHLTGSAGGRIPVDFDKETASLHYSLQADYYVCRWFIPFVAANGFTVVSEGKGPAFGGLEGYDLINFGASDASGYTAVTVGAGFRSRLLDNLDVGIGAEIAVANPKGLFDHRITADLILRF